MKISIGKGVKGSSGIVQCRPRMCSKLFVSNLPSEVTTAQSSSNDINSQSSSPLIFQNREVPSRLPVPTNSPSGSIETEVTTSVLQTKRLTSLPVFISHKRAVLSSLPVTAYRPSIENVTDLTLPEWPTRLNTLLRVRLSRTSTSAPTPATIE